MLLLGVVELQQPNQRPEIATLLLLGSAGGVVFATGPDLLSATLGLETLSLGAVTLIALSRGRQPLEAAFKYFVLASISFAVLLFGLGLVYLATGSFAWPTLTSAEPALPLAAAGGRAAGRAGVRLRIGAGAAPFRDGGCVHGRAPALLRLRDGGQQDRRRDRAEPADRAH